MLLEKVKTYLRITHSYLDSEIEDTIEEARAEMVRAGVLSDVAYSSNPLVLGAVKTYCAKHFADDMKDAEGYEKSWSYQLDNIRKSTLEA